MNTHRQGAGATNRRVGEVLQPRTALRGYDDCWRSEGPVEALPRPALTYFRQWSLAARGTSPIAGVNDFILGGGSLGGRCLAGIGAIGSQYDVITQSVGQPERHFA